MPTLLKLAGCNIPSRFYATPTLTPTRLGQGVSFILMSEIYIFLWHFRFTKLPSVLYSLPKLEIIFANDNKVETIDAEGVKNLSALATLDLQNNNIGQVPPELGLCTQIK